MKQSLVVGSEPVSHFGLVGLLKEFNDLMIPVLVLVARGVNLSISTLLVIDLKDFEKNSFASCASFKTGVPPDGGSQVPAHIRTLADGPEPTPASNPSRIWGEYPLKAVTICLLYPPTGRTNLVQFRFFSFKIKLSSGPTALLVHCWVARPVQPFRGAGARGRGGAVKRSKLGGVIRRCDWSGNAFFCMCPV